MGKRNRYQARKSITKVSCRISSLRKVAEEVKGPCESPRPWFLFTARLDAGAHVCLHEDVHAVTRRFTGHGGLGL